MHNLVIMDQRATGQPPAGEPDILPQPDGIMQTYVCLMKLTAQGVKNIKEAPQRIDEALQFAKALGGKVVDVYVTMGDYDYVAIGEFPDDEAALAFLLGLGAGAPVHGDEH